LSRVTFAPITPDYYDVLRLALEVAGLPVLDLDDPGGTFFALSDDNGPIGFVGLEGYGADRLLRSLVVLPSRKRRGHGALLVAHAEAWARRADVARLHLLTTSAADFFRARGYRPRDRAEAPPAIAGTALFGSLCPASATYLAKDLKK